ncbi:MAG: hypothetical protein WD795_02675 [Woeseia sp.]
MSNGKALAADLPDLLQDPAGDMKTNLASPSQVVSRKCFLGSVTEHPARRDAEVHKAGGGNYQTLMNHGLREYINGANEPLEEILRRVLREELHNTK